MKLDENWVVPAALTIWILVTIVISFLVLKAMQKIASEVPTDWPANIIAMVVGLTTAVIMAGAIYVSAMKSSEQIAMMQSQIKQLDDFRTLENTEKDKKSLFEIEHYFKSYEDIFYDVGRKISFLDDFLDTENHPLLKELKANTWVDDTPLLTLDQKETLFKNADQIFKDRYELPDRPNGLDRLPSSFSRAYHDLVRIDRRGKINLKSMVDRLKTEYDVILYYNALKEFQFQVAESFGGLVYEMEKYNRELNNLAPAAPHDEWKSRIYRIDHPNRLALETVRYPRMKIWAKDQLEYRKYNLAEESPEFEIEILEGNDGDHDVDKMKLQMRKAMGYILHYHNGVTEFRQRLPAPQDRNRLEYRWK